MTKVRVAGFSISLDGFGAGPEQSLENPLGKRGRELHQWFFGTRTFRAMTGEGGGSDGVDEAYAHRSMDGFGAFILGRNMFGPIRGPWPDQSWKGWWGANPPYHAPTFVLTHHPRDPIEMEGGTTFIFVTKGIEAALDQAKQAANGRDVKIGGGVETVRQYLRAGLIDELHLALSPVVLGQGEAMFAGIDLPALGFRVHRTPGDRTRHPHRSRPSKAGPLLVRITDISRSFTTCDLCPNSDIAQTIRSPRRHAPKTSPRSRIEGGPTDVVDVGPRVTPLVRQRRNCRDFDEEVGMRKRYNA